jgi:hypothetical protein
MPEPTVEHPNTEEDLELSDTFEVDFTGTNATKERQMALRHAFRYLRNTIILNTRNDEDRKDIFFLLNHAKALSQRAAQTRYLGMARKPRRRRSTDA